MQMMNRAIEDASDFMDMKRKLLEGHEAQVVELARLRDRMEAKNLITPLTPQPPRKRPDENRAQYRARVRAMGKVSA